MLLAVALVSSMAFVACGDDDDDDDLGGGTVNPKDKIVGTWTVNHYKGWEKMNGTVTEEWDEDVVPGYTIYRFETTGIVYMYEGTSVETAKWSKKGNKLTITWIEDGDIEKNELTVKTLTDKKLEIEESEKDKENGITYEYWEVTTLERYDD